MPLNKQVNIPGRKYEVGEDYFSSLTSDGDETAQRYFKHLSMTKFPEYVNFGAIYELVVDWMTGSKTIFHHSLSITASSFHIKRKYRKNICVIRQLQITSQKFQLS